MWLYLCFMSQEDILREPACPTKTIIKNVININTVKFVKSFHWLRNALQLYLHT